MDKGNPMYSIIKVPVVKTLINPAPVCAYTNIGAHMEGLGVFHLYRN